MNKERSIMWYCIVMENSIHSPLIFNCIPIKHEVILLNNVIMFKQNV